MLAVNYAAAETRLVVLEAVNTIPQAVGALGRELIQFRPNTPDNAVPPREFWQVIAGGVRVTFGTVDLTITSAAAFVTEQKSGGALFVPCAFANFHRSALYGIASINLQGVELRDGDDLLILVEVDNAHATLARNVTATVGGLRVRPMLMVSEQAVSMLDGQRVDPYLDQRLRRGR